MDPPVRIFKNKRYKLGFPGNEHLNMFCKEVLNRFLDVNIFLLKPYQGFGEKIFCKGDSLCILEDLQVFLLADFFRIGFYPQNHSKS